MMKKVCTALAVVGMMMAASGCMGDKPAADAKPAGGAAAKPGVAGSQPGRIDPGTVPPDSKLRASRGATAGVIYSNSLAAIYAPEDKKEWSAFDEFGWKNAGPYKTYGDMPAGWWVYSDPYWVIWDLKNGKHGQ